MEFTREIVLAGSEVGRNDDVSGDEVGQGRTKGEERVYAIWTVVMETVFMEVWIICEATEAMGSLVIGLVTYLLAKTQCGNYKG
jgi:hypothetical protein